MNLDADVAAKFFKHQQSIAMHRDEPKKGSEHDAKFQRGLKKPLK